MKYSQIRDAILMCRMAKVSLLIWGHRGMGKTALVKQVAKENNWGYVQFRIAQIESTDLRGMPDKEGGRTRFLPPEELPRDGEGILFLDEINRAAHDVLQAVFQLVEPEEHRIGTYILPPGWSVVAAANYENGSYITSGFSDPAFLSRFCHVTMDSGEEGVEEWASWFASEFPEENDILSFICGSPREMLDGKVDGSLDYNIQPSRRSWVMATKIRRAGLYLGVDNETIQEALCGVIGTEAAIAFMKYRCPVSPKDLINDGVEKHKNTILKLNRGQLLGLVWSLAGRIKEKAAKDEKMAELGLSFVKLLLDNDKDRDIIASFMKLMVTGEGLSKLAQNVSISNPAVAAIINGSGGNKFFSKLAANKELHSLCAKNIWGGK